MARDASRAERLAFAALVTLAVALALHRMEDFDVWYHLAAGRLIWSSGRWPTANTFAFTAPDYTWTDLHWLFQLALYGAHAAVGINGCIVLAAALLVATASVLYGLARRALSPVPAALLVATALTAVSPRFVPRPELVSFVLFALYLRLLEGQPDNGRAIWWLVPLQVVWVNVQGIFAVGLALIGCYWLGATLAFLPVPAGWRVRSALPPAAWRRLTAVLVLATVACLLNPYGLAGALFPFELLPRVTGSSFLSQRIGEFRGPFASGYAPALAWTWAGLLASAALLLLLDLRRWHLGRTLALVAFAVLGSQSLRNMAFPAWMAVLVIAAHAGGAAGTLDLRRGGRVGAGVQAGLAWGGIAAIVLLVAAVATNRFSRALGVEREFGLGVSTARFPLEAIDFLQAAGIEGRPFNCLAMGGFLAWYRPAGGVFVDGRLEAFPEAVLRTYFGVMDDPRAWPGLDDTYGFDYAFLFHLWPNRLPLASFLARGRGWQLVYYDPIASIFVPADDAHREVRERAQRVFAELAVRRADSDSSPAPTASLVVPIAEVWRTRALGNFVAALGDPARAIRAFRHTLALDPDASDARYALGVAYWETGDHAAALREWNEVVRRDRGGPFGQHAERAIAQTRAR